MTLYRKYRPQTFAEVVGQEHVKGVILEEIKMYEDTPDEIIYDLLFKGIWKNHPLAFPVTGECSSILPMTREDIIRMVLKSQVASNGGCNCGGESGCC